MTESPRLAKKGFRSRLLFQKKQKDTSDTEKKDTSDPRKKDTSDPENKDRSDWEPLQNFREKPKPQTLSSKQGHLQDKGFEQSQWWRPESSL